jgi:hypothetical protein
MVRVMVDWFPSRVLRRRIATGEGSLRCDGLADGGVAVGLFLKTWKNKINSGKEIKPSQKEK